MAAPRFIGLIAGKFREIAALAARTSAADGEKIVSTRADGLLDETLLTLPLSRVAAGKTVYVPADRVMLVSQLGLTVDGDIVNDGDIVEV